MTATNAMGSLAVIETRFKTNPGRRADRFSLNRSDNYCTLRASRDEVQHPARHQTSGDVEINSSPVVTFPPLYAHFLEMGVYHHGHHHH